jgi:hypothetical protein
MVAKSTPESKAANKAACDARRKIKSSTPEFKAAKRAKYKIKNSCPVYKAAQSERYKIKTSTPEWQAARRIVDKIRESKPEYKAAKNAKYKIKVSSPAYKAAQAAKKCTPHHGVVITRIIKRRPARSTPEFKAMKRAAKLARQRMKVKTSEQKTAINAKQKIRRSTPQAKAAAKIKRDDPVIKAAVMIRKSAPKAKATAKRWRDNPLNKIRQREARIAKKSTLGYEATKAKIAMQKLWRSSPEFKAAQSALRKIRSSTPAYKAHRKIMMGRPEAKAKSKLRSTAYEAKKTKTRLDKAYEFIEVNGVDISATSLSDEEAFKYIVNLMDDTESLVGKGIYEALGGMTLRTAYWEGKSDSAMYALMSRGDATVGGCKAEFSRFLVANATNTPILTRGDDNQSFKYTDKLFQDLGLIYCPIRAFDNYADVTTLESAFQLLFDFLEVGRQRLWKVSGVGKSTLPLRKCDKLYIERTNDKKLVFMFGITIMRNVTVVERKTEASGKEIVTCITGGLGTKCNVNQGTRRAPIINESQRTALVKAQASITEVVMQQM